MWDCDREFCIMHIQPVDDREWRYINIRGANSTHKQKIVSVVSRTQSTHLRSLSLSLLPSLTLSLSCHLLRSLSLSPAISYALSLSLLPSLTLSLSLSLSPAISYALSLSLSLLPSLTLSLSPAISPLHRMPWGHATSLSLPTPSKLPGTSQRA